jgi:hypothetical protein
MWFEGKSIQERFNSHFAELADEAFERLLQLWEPEGEQVTDLVLKRCHLSTSALKKSVQTSNYLVDDFFEFDHYMPGI